MCLLFHPSPRDGLLGSSQHLALAIVSTMNRAVLASFLTDANVSVGWIPGSEMVLAYLRAKINAWQVQLP